jgi:electron transport complex protein RnfB
MDLTTITVIIAAVSMLILSVLMGYVLGWANVKFAVKVDQRITDINVALPGANCGGCGYVGCNDYAEAVVNNGAAINLCAPGGASCAEAIASIMGVEVGETLPYRPVVHCAAGYDQRLKRHEYTGEKKCISANMVAGVQGCTYGCLGFGDCKKVCKYVAIEIVNGLSTIDYEKCIGCGACAKICPRRIITMVPFKYERVLVVKCSNKDFGKEVTEVCTFGCIGCKSCTRNSPIFSMDANIPVIDYDKFDPSDSALDVVLDKCPRESLVYVGKPTPKHIETVKGEEVPKRVKADFKTTVDEAEWRG